MIAHRTPCVNRLGLPWNIRGPGRSLFAQSRLEKKSSNDADRLVNPHCSVRLATAWGVPHARHPWAGHDLPHDDPQWLCETAGASMHR